MTGTGRCHLCDEPVPTFDLLGHVRVMHPDQYEPPAVWPDGGPVIEDATLTPEDFNA